VTLTKRQYDYAVFIGRFEPFHNAHRRVIEKAFTVADKVIVLIGSGGKPRSIKDPFFVEERKVMQRSAFSADAASRLLFGQLHDFPYNDERWTREVQAQVAQLVVADNTVLNGPKRICLVGHFKDRSTEYLRMFPQWPLVEAPNHEQRSATDLRTLMFEAAGHPDEATGKWMLVESAVPVGVYAFLREFARGDAFAQLVREHEFIKGYKAQFASLPYPPTFVTVDAVVVHSGHILLVKRGAEPGKGLWALPGGFIGHDELLLDACIRELKEETRLKLPEPVLRGSIKGQRVFDRPDRSLRGRTITHAYYFEFPSGELPPVKGGDDAAKARWVPLAEFYDMEGMVYEDHYGIATSFLGV
jgi:bifunctional NMN adenylyltransferase/nudix hydrolase